MLKRVSLFFVFCTCTVAHSAVIDEVQQKQWVDTAVVEVFQPLVGQLSESTEKLQQSLAGSCDALQSQAVFVAVVDDFSYIEYYRLGAMNSANRAERIFFWPDRKGTGQKQMRRLLADPDRGALDADSIAKKSVALQGLPALERILFGQTSALNAADCRVAQAIADNVHSIAQQLEEDWKSDDGVAYRLQNPTKSSVYRSSQESVAALLTVAESGLESIADKKIQAMIKGLQQLAVMPKNAPFWRSGQTLSNLENNLHGIERLLIASGMAESAAAEGKLSFEFDNASRMIAAVAEALASGDAETAISRLQALGFIVKSLHALSSEDVSVKLGIVTGFNSSDGD